MKLILYPINAIGFSIVPDLRPDLALSSSISCVLFYGKGTRRRSWLLHYATSRQVAGSIPDEVIGFFNWPNPSSRTMALGLSQPLTEMSIRNLPDGKERSGVVRLRTLLPSVSRLSSRCGSLDVSHSNGSLRPVTGIALPFLLHCQHYQETESRPTKNLKKKSECLFFVRLLALRPIVPASGDSEDDCGEVDGM
jgi:hypothetical protein